MARGIQVNRRPVEVQTLTVDLNFKSIPASTERINSILSQEPKYINRSLLYVLVFSREKETKERPTGDDRNNDRLRQEAKFKLAMQDKPDSPERLLRLARGTE